MSIRALRWGRVAETASALLVGWIPVLPWLFAIRHPGAMLLWMGGCMATATLLEVARAIAPAFALRGIRVVVGPDGVRCNVRGRVHFYRWERVGYASIRQRAGRGESLAVCGPDGQALLELPILHDACRRRAAAFVRSFDEWLPHATVRTRSDVRHPWRRRGRPLEEWIRDLDREVRGGGGAYRTVHSDRGRLMDMLRDASLPEDLRAAAGWLIGRTACEGKWPVPAHQALPPLAWRMIRLATAPQAFVPKAKAVVDAPASHRAEQPVERRRTGVSWMAIRLETMSAAIAYKSLFIPVPISGAARERQ